MAQKTIWHCVRDNTGFQKTDYLSPAKIKEDVAGKKSS